MEVEWSTTAPGKLGLDAVKDTVRAAAAPIGVKRVSCELRRASVLFDQITYKYDQNDPLADVEALYAKGIESASLVLGAYSGETRDAIALLHVSYDGRRSRLRIETSSLRFIERFRDQFAAARDTAEPEA